MKYVYLMRSLCVPGRRYVGLTENLNRRLEVHNAGRSVHTRRYVPWEIVVAIRFSDDRRAIEFERYLKSGSGHAFANRHLWSQR